MDRLGDKGRKALSVALEQTRTNIEWMERSRGKVLVWIRRRNEERRDEEE